MNRNPENRIKRLFIPNENYQINEKNFNTDILFFSAFREFRDKNSPSPSPELNGMYNIVKERLFRNTMEIINDKRHVSDIMNFIDGYEILRSFTYIDALYNKIEYLYSIGIETNPNEAKRYIDENSDLKNIRAIQALYDIYMSEMYDGYTAENYFKQYRNNKNSRFFNKEKYENAKNDMYYNAEKILRGKTPDEILKFFEENPIYAFIYELNEIKNKASADRNRAPPPESNRAPPPESNRAPPPRNRAPPHQQPPESNRAAPHRPPPAAAAAAPPAPPAAAAPIEKCPADDTELPQICESKSQYKRLALKIHPDKNPGCKERSEEKFIELGKLCAKVIGGSKNKSKAKKKKSKSVKKRQSRKSNK